jgi:hypothetical protein
MRTCLNYYYYSKGSNKLASCCLNKCAKHGMCAIQKMAKQKRSVGASGSRYSANGTRHLLHSTTSGRGGDDDEGGCR